MFKVINFILVILILSSETDAQFIRKWEKSAALGNLPSWFSTTSNLQRGIAFTWDTPLKLLVIADAEVPTVIILNAMTGDSIGTLNTTGISGGLLALSDISTGSGLFAYYPNIYACNLTENAVVDPFKIYMWEDVNSAPQLIVIDSVSNFRLGDRLNVSDEFYTWASRHLTTGSSGSDKILDYISADLNPPFIRNVITLSDGSQGNNVSAFFDTYLSYYLGGYLVNSDGRLPSVYNNSGSLQVVSPDSVISPSTNSIKFFINLLIDKYDYVNDFYVTYNYNGKYADLVLSHLYMPHLWGHTPSMGNNISVNNFGDVEYIWQDTDSLYIFVLAGNNGIGAYHADGCYLPVELVSFTAETINTGILLKWITATEINNKGFDIEKTSPMPSTSEGEGEEWAVIGFVEGNGTTTRQTSYSFKDIELSQGTYKYRLKQIDYDGSYKYSDIVEITMGLPQEYVLMQNYPNPFNPATRISYSIPGEALVNLSVFNLLGQKVAELKNEVMQAGNYETEFDGSKLTSGTYFYSLQSGSFISTKKMMIIK